MKKKMITWCVSGKANVMGLLLFTCHRIIVSMHTNPPIVIPFEGMIYWSPFFPTASISSHLVSLF